MDFFMLADMARDLDVPCNGVMADHQHADNHVHEFIFTGEFSVCRQCGVTDSQHVQFENAEEGFRGPEATEGTSRLGLENAQDTLFSEGFRLATRVGDRRLNNINRRICSNNKDSKIYADGNFISEMCVKLSLHSDISNIAIQFLVDVLRNAKERDGKLSPRGKNRLGLMAFSIFSATNVTGFPTNPLRLVDFFGISAKHFRFGEKWFHEYCSDVPESTYSAESLIPPFPYLTSAEKIKIKNFIKQNKNIFATPKTAAAGTIYKFHPELLDEILDFYDITKVTVVKYSSRLT